MKKIGILTFHFADNFGAILQAYALNKVINSIEGYYAEIIDYVPSNFKYEHRWTNVYEKNLFFKKRTGFKEFLKKNCYLTTKTNFVNGKEYDIYCVGSDQVWNTACFYEEYFLVNVSKEVRKISYASSIALSNNSPYLKKEIFKQYISEFDRISVREEESVELIEKITNKKCERVCDPTLLLDIEEYEDITEEIEYEGKYILLFWLLNDSNVFVGIEFANRIARKYNLEIIHSLYGEYEKYIINNKRGIFYISPGQFLSYIKHASYVVTNSYHVTLFSLRYERKVYIHLVESMKSRFETIFNIYDIENCLIDNYLLEGIKEVQIDFEKIKKQMVCEKQKGMKYLLQAIGDK